MMDIAGNMQTLLHTEAMIRSFKFMAEKGYFITSRPGIIFGRLNLLTRRSINILQVFMARTSAQYGYESPRMVYFGETDSPFVYHFCLI